MFKEVLTQVIISVVGIIISGLGALTMYYIKTKITNEKLQKILSNALGVVSDGVNYVHQTYVSNLKGTDLWDEVAMKKANEQAVEYIKNNLSTEIKNYLTQNGKDIAEWIQEQIEIAINTSK